MAPPRLVACDPDFLIRGLALLHHGNQVILALSRKAFQKPEWTSTPEPSSGIVVLVMFEVGLE